MQTFIQIAENIDSTSLLLLFYDIFDTEFRIFYF